MDQYVARETRVVKSHPDGGKGPGKQDSTLVESGGLDPHMVHEPELEGIERPRTALHACRREMSIANKRGPRAASGSTKPQDGSRGASSRGSGSDGGCRAAADPAEAPQEDGARWGARGSLERAKLAAEPADAALLRQHPHNTLVRPTLLAPLTVATAW